MSAVCVLLVEWWEETGGDYFWGPHLGSFFFGTFIIFSVFHTSSFELKCRRQAGRIQGVKVGTAR